MNNFKAVMNYLGVHIDIELKDKFCIFNGPSGTGKTFLFDIVGDVCQQRSIKYVRIDYKLKDLSAEAILAICAEADIICLDNADLYLTKDIIKSLSDLDAVILISIKSAVRCNFRGYGQYLVHFDSESLVTERWRAL